MITLNTIFRLAIGTCSALSLSTAVAQPSFSNPSPTAGSGTSETANAMADKAVYKPVTYTNAAKKGLRWSSFPARSKAITPPSHKSSVPTILPTMPNWSLATPTSRFLNVPTWARCSMSSSWPTPWATRRRRASCCKREIQDNQVGRQVRHPEGRAGRTGAVRG